jgi:hypothetical protein
MTIGFTDPYNLIGDSGPQESAIDYLESALASLRNGADLDAAALATRAAVLFDARWQIARLVREGTVAIAADGDQAARYREKIAAVCGQAEDKKEARL